MDDYKRVLVLIENHVEDQDLKQKLIELVETEARRERWELEKKRRHEVSLDIEKVAIKVEFEISLQHNDLAPNIHEHDVDDNVGVVPTIIHLHGTPNSKFDRFVSSSTSYENLYYINPTSYRD